MSPEQERGQLNQNIEAVLDFYSREDQKISWSQRTLERISQVIGKPAYLGFILALVLLWIGVINVRRNRDQVASSFGW